MFGMPWKVTMVIQASQYHPGLFLTAEDGMGIPEMRLWPAYLPRIIEAWGRGTILCQDEKSKLSMHIRTRTWPRMAQ